MLLIVTLIYILLTIAAFSLHWALGCAMLLALLLLRGETSRQPMQWEPYYVTQRRKAQARKDQK